MKAFNRRLLRGFVMVGMLGFAGCGPDNESEGSEACDQSGRSREAGRGIDSDSRSRPRRKPTKSVHREGRRVRKTRSRRAASPPRSEMRLRLQFGTGKSRRRLRIFVPIGEWFGEYGCLFRESHTQGIRK